mgnify:FL=1
MKRIIRNLYYDTIIRRVDGEMRYVSNPDGTLFSGVFKTKIKPEDLPEWYFYGRYYKRWGFLSTKGIVDMVYVPLLLFDTFLKDDVLLVSYHNKIEEVPPPEEKKYLPSFERYRGYDERVYGSEIITILKGAREYSGYDITPIIKQMKDEIEFLKRKYPDRYSDENFRFDFKERFSQIYDWERKRGR